MMEQLLAQKNSRFRQRPINIKLYSLSLLAILISTSCQSIDIEKSIAMNWSEFDIDLPEGIKLYQGRNKTIPLKAWVAKIDLSNSSISVKVLSSNDKDRKETPMQFLGNNEARLVLNGGYFIQYQLPKYRYRKIYTNDLV